MLSFYHQIIIVFFMMEDSEFNSVLRYAYFISRNHAKQLLHKIENLSSTARLKNFSSIPRTSLPMQNFGFYGLKELGAFILPPGWDISVSQFTHVSGPFPTDPR